MKILSIFGTRPEAIKMAPVIKSIEKHSSLTSIVCSTGQHLEMLNQVIDFFNIHLDYEINAMSKNQTLNDLTLNLLENIQKILAKAKPDLVLVHGDTTTTFAAAYSSFLSGIKVGHIEAGLRSGNIKSPWPEEANRKLTSVISEYHFAPSLRAKNHLIKEGVNKKKILITGNTVVDALLMAEKTLNTDLNLSINLQKKFNYLKKYKKFILVTVHRRESFGDNLLNICEALANIAHFNHEIALVIPVHLNPNVRKVIFTNLNEIENIFLVEPLNYSSFIYLMKNCYFLLTDSGGIQEEAPSFSKPVIVLRDVTERPEGVEAGCLELIGTNKDTIFLKAQELINDKHKYKKMTNIVNPYGDGNASKKIVEFILKIQS